MFDELVNCHLYTLVMRLYTLVMRLYTPVMRLYTPAMRLYTPAMSLYTPEMPFMYSELLFIDPVTCYVAECDRSQLISLSPRKITRFESLPVGQALEAGFYGLDENGSSTREQSSTLQQ